MRSVRGSLVKRTEKAIWLLALDGSKGSERAAEYVARTAPRTGVREIHLVYVQPFEGVRGYALQRPNVLRAAGEAARRTTASVSRMLESAGLAPRLHAPVGADPASVIAAIAQRQAVQDIVLGTRGMSAAGNLVLGSVAYKVIHLARQPVTLVPHPRDGGGVRLPAKAGTIPMLLAADGSRHAARAATYVCRLHKAGLPLEVHLLNVQPRILSGNVRRFVSQAQINAYSRKQGESALRGARRLLDRAGIKYRYYIRAGACPETIVGLALERSCTRIIMGTRGMGAIKGLVLGSVTYGVVHLATTPVTLVK